MRVVRDCPQAQYLPSRYHFALCRLLALAASSLRSPAPPRVDRIAHALDRDQSAVENYAVAIWFLLTLACYLIFLLPLRLPFAILGAIVMAPLSVQIAIPLLGGAFTLMRMKNNMTMVSTSIMSVMIALSSYLATASTPIRLVAWFFLAIVTLNAMAWLILIPLRNRIHELEERCGA